MEAGSVLQWHGVSVRRGVRFGGLHPALSNLAVLDTVQEQGRQANQPAGSASEASKQEQQQARPACSLLRGSEVTLGSFLAQFWSFSVPHCHGDLPLGAAQFLGALAALAALDTVQEQGKSASRISKRGQQTTAASKTSACSFFTGFRGLKLC